MVITRSHINEQISKGGKKMGVGYIKKKPKYVKDPKIDTGFKPGSKMPKGVGYVKGSESKRQQEIRKAHEEFSKKRKAGEKRKTFGWEEKTPKKTSTKKKGDTTDTTKKSIEDKFGDQQPDLKTIPPKKDKLKKIKAGGQTIIFGSKEMKEKAFSKRVKRKAGGGDVVMQKVRKYKEGGTVVHDQSTIKNL